MNSDETVAKRVLFNTTALICMNITGMLIGFIVTPISIDRVGLQNYGLWAILNGVIGYFTLFDLGASSTFITQFSMFLAKGDQRGIREVMTFGIVFYILLGAIFSPVAWLIAPHLVYWFHFNPVDKLMVTHVFWWTYAYLFLTQAVGGFWILLLAAQKMVFTSVLGFACQLLNSAVLVVALVLRQSLYAFLIANYASLGLSLLVTILMARRLLGGRLTISPMRIRKETVKSLLSFAGWMQINNVANQIDMETDRVLIGWFVNTGATGTYQLINKLALLCRSLPLTLLRALLPAFSKMTIEEGGQKISIAYIEASRLLAIMTFFIAGFTLACSSPIMVLWLGKILPHLSPILGLLLFSYVINNLTGIGTTFLRSIAKPRLETYYAILGTVLNVVLTIALVHQFGMFGILSGTVIGSVVSSVYFLWIFQRSMQLPWWGGLIRWLWPIVAATGISGGIVYELSNVSFAVVDNSRFAAASFTVLLGLVYTGLFISVLKLLHYFSPQDLVRLKGLVPERFLGSRVGRAFHAVIRGVLS